MQPLWAPWRMEYLLAEVPSHSGPDTAPGCIFCFFPSAGPSHYREHLILCATPQAFAIMNRFPYANGHVMVIPRRHGPDPSALPDDEYVATNELLRGSMRAVRDVMGAHGLNVGMNLGKVAGAGIAEHCHWHIVPRWSGDVNFMPVLADVRVMGEHIRATYERLLPAFALLGEGPT